MPQQFFLCLQDIRCGLPAEGVPCDERLRDRAFCFLFGQATQIGSDNVDNGGVRFEL